MIDHISIPVRDLWASAAFYDKVLAPMGYRRLAERENTIGYGKRYPEFWLNRRPDLAPAPADSGHHACLRARDKSTVRAFHAAATAADAGGSDDGAPGLRQGEMTDYYGAFVRDPDGNRIEALTVPAGS